MKSKTISCSGPLRRREFLRAEILALGGLTLPQLLATRATAGVVDPDTSVILFWMWGGHAPKNFSDQIGLGQDHWPQAFSAFISGGGLRMGQVVGQTNSKSEYPLHDPVTPQDLLATVYRHLGINPQTTLTDFSGRLVPILDHGRPISQLI